MPLRLCLLLVLVHVHVYVCVCGAEAETVGDPSQSHRARQWVLEIDGGKERCDELAQAHGLDCVGEVGSLPGLFLVKDRKLKKRSVAIDDVFGRLLQDGEIRRVRQQQPMRRFKRDSNPSPLPQQSFKFTDPLYHRQWYITGGSRSGHTLNVLNAWHRSYTGKGVVVAIMDDGLEHAHPDLSQNYDPLASFDLVDNDTDPTPMTRKDGHGTRCAGAVAAVANNSLCVVGLAYGAKVGGLRVPFDDTSDAIEASAISFKTQHIHIYSGSWGPSDKGAALEGPGELAQQAFVNGVTKGRKGLGSIYVWASGNGGLYHDSCSCDGYASSIYTISVSSTDFNTSMPKYTEQCPSTLLTTFSSSGAAMEPGISTLDIGGNCTSSFGATSAAAPLAAGIYALVLEANPELSWRDAQYIGMLAADDEPFVDANWQENGIGRRYSYKYGFGLMDADAMVSLAELWTPTPPQHECSSVAWQPLQLAARSQWKAVLNFNACSESTTVRFLEHVVLVLSLNTTRRGHVNISLTSPSGTKSRLLQNRPRDLLETSFDMWPFMSVQFWGENPIGKWTLEIFIRNGNSGQVDFTQLTVYGTASPPITLSEEVRAARLRRTGHVLHAAPNPIIVSRRVDRVLKLHSATYLPYTGPCDPECAGPCSGPTNFDCASCRHYVLPAYPVAQCVPNCPNCHYPSNSQPNGTVTCLPCSASCTVPPTCLRPAPTSSTLLTAGIATLLAGLVCFAVVAAIVLHRRRKRLVPIFIRAFSDDHLVQLLKPTEHEHEYELRGHENHHFQLRSFSIDNDTLVNFQLQSNMIEDDALVNFQLRPNLVEDNTLVNPLQHNLAEDDALVNPLQHNLVEVDTLVNPLRPNLVDTLVNPQQHNLVEVDMLVPLRPNLVDALVNPLQQNLVDVDTLVNPLRPNVVEVLVNPQQHNLVEDDALVNPLNHDLVEVDTPVNPLHHNLVDVDTLVNPLRPNLVEVLVNPQQHNLVEVDTLVNPLNHNLVEDDALVNPLQHNLVEDDALVNPLHHRLVEDDALVNPLHHNLVEDDALVNPLRPVTDEATQAAQFFNQSSTE